MIDAALDLVRRGFWVFPIVSGSKKPAIKRWQHEATQDPARLHEWFDRDDPRPNIGVVSERFGVAGALLVLDVDTKNGKDGMAELLRLELAGFELPDTLTAETPTGGRHLFFSVETAVRQGADKIGTGLDVRSRGGYVLGAGSTIDGKPYRWLLDAPIAPAPAWLVERCGVAVRHDDRRQDQERIQVDAARALSRARQYLLADAPVAIEGQHGDETTFKVAARLKDFGLDADAALGILLEIWNGRCTPPWPVDELAAKVRNAYAYGFETQGAAAPESDFKPVAAHDSDDHPLAWLNKRHAYIIVKNADAILWETEDVDGRFEVQLLPVQTFSRMYAARQWTPNKKRERMTESWIEWDKRRSYRGLVFMPEQPLAPGYYNLWRGFQDPEIVDTAQAAAAFQMYTEHMRMNICANDVALFSWLTGYLAHLVQRPWEKPHVALVLKGRKGVGKNAFVERVCDLLGGHAMVAARRRYLVSNFNGHLERLLMFVLDEAFWSGDKEVEGILKDLVTGSFHQIERKGHESYSIRNLTRVVILTNEDWAIPASHDERRFAVFDVGDGRRKDTAFFQAMVAGMRAGGNRLLLDWLRSIDLTGFDVNSAPLTTGLLEQKLASLSPFQQWWLDSLTEGRLVSSDFGDEWPRELSPERLRRAFRVYMRERNVTARLPADNAIGRELKKLVPGIGVGWTGGRVYKIATLDECRAAWCGFIGHKMEWPA